MKVLFTIDEYRTRAINLVIKTVKETIKEDADDYFKYQFIDYLVNECFTNHIALMEQSNQMYIKVFCLDRNGKRLDSDSIKKIDKKEVDEFNAQKWYADRRKKHYVNDKAYSHWNEKEKMKLMVTSYHLGLLQYSSLEIDEIDDLYTIETTITKPFFEGDCIGNMTDEIFIKLYGYEFKYNKEFKVKQAFI